MELRDKEFTSLHALCCAISCQVMVQFYAQYQRKWERRKFCCNSHETFEAVNNCLLLAGRLCQYFCTVLESPMTASQNNLVYCFYRCTFYTPRQCPLYSRELANAFLPS